MRVHDLLFRSAAACADAPALEAPPRRWTYGELAELVTAAARGLHALGVRRGDRVVMALDNSVEFAAAYFGAMAAGAVAVPLPPGGRSDRLPKAIADCSPAALVTDRTTLAMLPGPVRASVRASVTVDDAPEPAVPFGAMVAEGRAASTVLPRGIDLDLAAIIYTSGSTGDPRGVMLSHLNIVANTSSIVTSLSLAASDRMLVVLPFHYVYGLSLLHTHVAVGGSLVLERRAAFPGAIVQSLADHAITGLAGVPSTYVMLLRRTNIARRALPALRYATQAGGPMSPAHVREWRSAQPQVAFYVMYGATEAAARLACLDASDVDRKPGSVGRAIPNVDLAIERDDGTLAGPGEVGELVARGSNIMAGYWNRPEETRQAVGPRGYRTGDLARVDEEGCVYIVGRRTDMLKVGAHRVGAGEIEDVLHEHAAVDQCAVVGEADELMGEVPVAYVVASGGETATEAALRAYCRERLPDYKVPARIVFLEALPKNESGKIDKRLLRELLVACRS